MKNGIIKQHFRIILLCWTLAVLLVTSLLYMGVEKRNLKSAVMYARGIWDHNLNYRKFVSDLGGLYAPIDKIQPNPYLNIPDKIIETKDGKKLTLINPAYMMRLVFERVAKETSPPIISRIVSEKFFNPLNEPDEWERKNFQKIKTGNEEITELTYINGEPYLRLFKPIIALESCLKCHGVQGYKKGDIRGAITVAIPVRDYIANIDSERKNLILAGVFTYLCGLIIILIMNKKVKKEQLIQDSIEHRLLNIFDSSPHWQYIINSEGKILMMSESVKEITGYDKEDFFNNPDLLVNIVDDEFKEKYSSHLKNSFNSKVSTLEFSITDKKGSKKWIYHICKPIKYDNNNICKLIINMDITDKKHMEQNLTHTEKMQSLGLLAGGVAHDFNNILTGIIGYCYLIKSELEDRERVIKDVDNILSLSKKATNLTRSLLAFSRKQMFDLKLMDLNLIIAEMEKLLKRVIGEHIIIETRLSPEKLIILADQSGINQVIMNLVVNAKDAMPDGGKIIIETKEFDVQSEIEKENFTINPGKYALLKVSDTGQGISKDVIDKIFEPFFTTKEKGRGTGLGLSVVYGIVKQLNGFIWVESEINKGSSFFVLIPLASIDRLEQKNNKKSKGEEDLTGNNEVVLLAEDNKEIREVLVKLLEMHNYIVIDAKDGIEAEEKIKANIDQIDLLILDVIMPGKDGKEVYNTIKSLKPDIKCIFMSGYTDEILKFDDIKKDEFYFISKPVDPLNFIKTIKSIIKKQK